MKNKICGLVLAVVAIAACTNSHPSAGGVTQPFLTPHSCHQRYETWNQSATVTTAFSALRADMLGVEEASSSGTVDMEKARQSIEKANAEAAILRSDPIPQCADPVGY